MHLHIKILFSFYLLLCAVDPAGVKSDTSGGGMRRAWTGRQVCDDTYWRCHCAVNSQIKEKIKKKTTTKKPIPCHTQPPLYCATLCFLSSLCVSCVKQRKTLLKAVLTPGTGTRVFSFSMYQCLVIPAAKGGRYYRHLQLF